MTQPYWTHDTLLFEGSFPTIDEKPIAIRGRWHKHREHYTEEYASASWLPLAPAAGQRLVLAIAPYLPAFAPTPEEPPALARKSQVGVLQKRSARTCEEQDLGIARGYAYLREHLLVLEECRLFSIWQPQREALEQFWQAAEHMLQTLDPDATRIITPGHDPDWLDEDFQAFLQGLGYVSEDAFRFEKSLIAPAKQQDEFRS